MPKKSSFLKKPSQSEEKPTAGQAKPVLKPGNKLGKEIDEIFGGKRKKTDGGTEGPATEGKEMKKTEKKRRRRREGEDERPTRTRRRRTEDGLAIYTEDELGFNKRNAGGTPRCPFDCDCCF